MGILLLLFAFFIEMPLWLSIVTGIFAALKFSIDVVTIVGQICDEC